MKTITVGAILLSLHMIRLTGPERQTVLLNPDQVVALKEPRGQASEHFHGSVKCLVFTTDNKYIPVVETCTEVRSKLQNLQEEE